MTERKPNGYWMPEKIDEVFDQMENELQRSPPQEEFGDKYGGALKAIQMKRYNPSISTWNGYLKYRRKSITHDFDKWKFNNVDSEFDKLEAELRRCPTLKEFEEKNGGMANAIIRGKFRGKYNQKIKSWNGYLKYRNKKLRHEPGKWTREEVDRVFDEQEKKLARCPTITEFIESYKGALNVIRERRYHHKVRSFDDYLKNRRKIKHGERKIWTPEKIDEVYDLLENELQRIPTNSEFKKRNVGALNSIVQGRYNPAIKTWIKYLQHRGRNPDRVKWSNEKVDKTYDSLEEELKRRPTQKEFSKRYPGAFSWITKGRYNISIHSFGAYLSNRGKLLHQNTPNSIGILESLLEEGESK